MIIFVPILRSYNATLNTHVVTQRWNYTVPAGKRAELCFASVRVIEFGGAIPNGAALVNININGIPILAAWSRNIVDAVTEQYFNSIFPLAAGDVITANTANSSAINCNVTVIAAFKEYT